MQAKRAVGQMTAFDEAAGQTGAAVPPHPLCGFPGQTGAAIEGAEKIHYGIHRDDMIYGYDSTNTKKNVCFIYASEEENATGEKEEERERRVQRHGRVHLKGRKGRLPRLQDEKDVYLAFDALAY